MAAPPEFTHIHCSSRFDRPASDLETDLDTWMAESDLITVTEVGNDNHAAKLREKGWSYFNSKLNQGQDDVGIAWENASWKRRTASTVKLSSTKFDRGSRSTFVYGASAVLRRPDSGFKLLISATHMPAHVEDETGNGHWRTIDDQWQARKRAYLDALTTWGRYVKDQERKHKCDAALIVADFNLNLKEKWVQDLLNTNFGDKYVLAWKHFPTSGGSLAGGPGAPAHDAPGQSNGDRIIDGSLYRNLKVTKEPDLMNRVASSDHRPYKESFRFMGAAEKPVKQPPDTTGDVQYGKEWWGFGDYANDEIYDVDRVFS